MVRRKISIYTEELLNETLKRDNSTLIEYPTKINSKTIIKFKCSCGKEGKKLFKNFYNNGGGYCSECCLIKTKDKIKETNKEKYGVENPFSREDIKNKIKETNKEKYGYEHAYKNKEIQEKTKETNLRKYGCENPFQNEEIKDKIKNKLKEKYGCEHPLQSEKIKEKFRNTVKEKFGVEYPSQNIEIMEKTQKNAKKYKNYKMPNGEIRKVQGYEHYALDELVKIYKESQILTSRKDIPRIEYTIENKKHYYFPDIYIPDDNKIIEVKSTWTYTSKKDNIPAKKEATIGKGFKYEIWVYNNKGKKIIVEL